MEEYERAIQVAIAEIRTPTRGVTQQFLLVHRVSMNGDQLDVARVDTSAEPGAFFVYFSVVDEPYYFVVVIRPIHNQITVSDSYVEAWVRTYLAIYSPLLTADDITQRLKLKPTATRTKGERIRPRVQRVYKEHRWYFHPQEYVPDDLEHKLAYLLDQVEPATREIVQLVDEYQCQVCIHIAYHGYKDQMWGWHADQPTIHRISTLGASVDLDLYASGPDLSD